MKNLFRKLGGMFLGLAMLSGVFVGVNSNKLQEANATPGDVVTSLSSISVNNTYCLYANFSYTYSKKSYTVDNYLKFTSTSTGQVTGKASGTSITDCSNFYILDSANKGFYNLKLADTNGYYFGSVNSNGKVNISSSPIDVTISLNSSGVITICSKDYSTYSIQCLKSGSSTTPTNQYFGSYSSSQFLPTLKISTEASAYSVTYDANGASSGTVPSDKTSYAPNSSVTVLGNTGSLTRTGYSFGGWNSNSSGTGTDYAVGSSFEITENKILYAKWIEKTLISVEFTSDVATKTDYFDGEKYSAAGLKLLLTYSDTSSETITIDDADSVTIYPEYASMNHESFLVEATVGEIKTSESKEVEVTVSENTMSLTWNDNFSTYTYLRDDQITSELIGTVKATWKAATQEHEKTKDLVFGTDYALGLYISRSDSSSSTNTPKIIIDSLPYSLTLEARNLYIGASYNGKITFKSTSLTIRNWRSVKEDTTVSGTVAYADSKEAKTGVLPISSSYTSYYSTSGTTTRFGSGSNGGKVVFTCSSTISTVIVTAYKYSDSENYVYINDTKYSSLGTSSEPSSIEISNVGSTSITIESKAKNQRFYLVSAVITCGGEVDVGKTEKCLGLEEFIETNMHMTDYTTELGYCKDTEHHYYSTAKAAFNDLTAEQRTLFNENDAYTNEHNRLVAWAAANGEIINSSNLLDQASSKQLLANIVDSSNSSLIIVIISLAGLTAIGGYFFYKKRKEN